MAWIGDSNTQVIEVTMDYRAYGWDADEIHAAHPHLSHAQIHAAFSYYHDHKAEFDAQMQAQAERHERQRAESPIQLTRAELLERLGRK